MLVIYNIVRRRDNRNLNIFPDDCALKMDDYQKFIYVNNLNKSVLLYGRYRMIGGHAVEC